MKASRILLIAAAVAMSVPAIALAQSKTSAKSAQVKRGEYMTMVSGCHDCHTPLKMGANGPEPDMSRMLSGHPQDMQLPPAPGPTGPWNAHVAATLTAWAGPWGVSYTANLTPDPETGVLRDFTEQQFIQTMRTGKHQGQGRQILPPMPWPMIGKMTDQDLKAIFAYLRQIPPVKNKVPDPIIATQ
ncbi:c-type cytochrome [Microvirga pakistanensis]|uniref:c-type cytochrome n=1 Tax=Microvirga pakistanensis TaxID=1682650 RepID=UPI00106C6433|nr:c-type cytochrome [Microvirga pakistanensis]